MGESELERKLSELLNLNLVNWRSVSERISELNLIKNNVATLKTRDDFNNFKRIIKALNHTARLEILISINNGITCPCELEFITGLAQATISHHLSILEDARLITRDRKGKWSILKSEGPNFIDDYISL